MADDSALTITETLDIPLAELHFQFSRSGGPGGQHVNRSATQVELTFDVAESSAFTAEQRDRLLERVGPVVRVVADDERSQLRNRALAEQRLASKLAAGLHVPRARRATRPTRSSVDRRIADKKRRGQTKAGRRRVGRGDE